MHIDEPYDEFSLSSPFHFHVMRYAERAKDRLPVTHRTVTFVNVRLDMQHAETRITCIAPDHSVSWASFSQYLVMASPVMDVSRCLDRCVKPEHDAEAAKRLDFVCSVVTTAVLRYHASTSLERDIQLALIATSACRHDPVDLKAGYCDLSVLGISVENAPFASNVTCTNYVFQGV